MASSPPYNRPNLPSSQSYTSHSPVSQPSKRRQSDMPSAAPSAKRRKASMLSVTSSSSHPLRQTSFPPERSAQDQRFSRSPSIESTSLVSGVSGTKNKRSRKPKGKADDESAVGGPAKSAVSGASGRGRRGTREPSLEEDEDEDGGGETAVAIEARTDEEAIKEKEHKAMLLGAFDSEQFDRFAGWRASKLSDSVVRRIVNQTLSQSAPQSVILAVRSVAKIFIGEMIEGGRRVQTQWQESDEESKATLPTPPAETGGEELRGPLLPDHLREAHRRHKLSSENSLAGQMGLWQVQGSSGVERFGPRAGGKRLFK